MTDILGSGTSLNYKSEKRDYYYEGLLFDKNVTRSTHFGNGKHYLIDVKSHNDHLVTEKYSITTFDNDAIPLSSLKGDKYFVIEDKPRFGRFTTYEDLMD